VTPQGRVAGINVAKRTDGELVSFLVPARFAAALDGLMPPMLRLAPIKDRGTFVQELEALRQALEQDRKKHHPVPSPVPCSPWARTDVTCDCACPLPPLGFLHDFDVETWRQS